MTVQERILTLCLLEKIKDNPKFAEKLGLEIVENKKNNNGGKEQYERDNIRTIK